MCGINGIVNRGTVSTAKLQLQLEKMNQLILHRGPDDQGTFFCQGSQFSLGMAMRRLAIIDLSSGHQPMFSEDGNLAIVFNGEIYNYRTLKNELGGKGVKFNTQSDTEVILRLYEKEGIKSLHKLDGMYAFAIFDKAKKTIYLARDFFGEKPLYYQHTSDGLVWASELKSIVAINASRPNLDFNALSIYFQLTYIPSPNTIFEGIKKLEPNTILEYQCETGKVTFSKIETVPAHPILDTHSSFNDFKEKTYSLLAKSVVSRTVSDVPIGTFLSGGVDSSIISYLLAKHSAEPIKTYSVGFTKSSFDESRKARSVANLLGSDHHEFILDIDEALPKIDKIVRNFDEPFADSSAIPSFMVSELTSQHVKVVLTGDGGDELFGGYNKYLIGKANETYTHLIPKWAHENIKGLITPFLATKHDKRGKRFKIRKLLGSIDYDKDVYRKIISLGFQMDELSSIFRDSILPLENPLKVGSGSNNLSSFREIDRKFSLEGDLLTKVDRTSMLCSLECRSPFLNKELWSFVNSVPDQYHIKNFKKKHLLKETFKDKFPPQFFDSKKQGFGVPVGDWLRTGLQEELNDFSSQSYIEAQGYFSWPTIRNLVTDHLDGKMDNTFRIWTFYCFQKWYETYMK